MVVGGFTNTVDTVVIGAGPGGYVAAIRAAQLGKKVTIIEKSEMGGVCLNVGCIPSKALIHAGSEFQKTQRPSDIGIEYGKSKLNMAKVQQWKNEQVVSTLTKGVEMLLKKNKVTIVKGEANFVSRNTVHVTPPDVDSGNMGESYQFQEAIIATGSRPIELKAFPFGENILDSTGVLALEELPKSLTFIGGGYIGMELAMAFASMGSQVTVIEGTDRVLNGFDADLVKPVLKEAERLGMKIITNAKATSSKEVDDGVELTYSVEGKEETVTSEKLAVMVGRKPNTDNISLELTGITTDDKGLIPVNEAMQTSVPHIYAIGDIVSGPALAHKASYEGKVAAEHLAGKKGSANDYLAIPTVAYTTPEIATVGLTESDCKEQGIEYNKATFMFAGNGRAITMEQTEGFIRLISDKENNTILGGQIVGPDASELIGQVALAIENLLTAEDVVLTIHNHPSLSEALMDTNEVLLGQGIHQ
ncbi:dihydrolipoyl dehydrogenase [Dolosicoccus paucivorans]|uniref:Dihydrolipoyl dehydrogenase n=1 Tax=Dolosicoccus paucivorans TaxID=84521 RepID=A0A2N6SLJ3_9LACT|nr:dihydrolipoyl dehydrogenase [Dolosicoccus paucivorans]PMB83806.1 dihydrolipoyl dehydrogenase [Dolosicoccus paucivorans]PMC57935.1 dihydrolipoyl dehydrogenase [Dolosicoccus paucivorans]